MKTMRKVVGILLFGLFISLTGISNADAIGVEGRCTIGVNCPTLDIEYFSLNVEGEYKKAMRVMVKNLKLPISYWEVYLDGEVVEHNSVLKNKGLELNNGQGTILYSRYFPESKEAKLVVKVYWVDRKIFYYKELPAIIPGSAFILESSSVTFREDKKRGRYGAYLKLLPLYNYSLPFPGIVKMKIGDFKTEGEVDIFEGAIVEFFVSEEERQALRDKQEAAGGKLLVVIEDFDNFQEEIHFNF